MSIKNKENEIEKIIDTDDYNELMKSINNFTSMILKFDNEERHTYKDLINLSTRQYIKESIVKGVLYIVL